MTEAAEAAPARAGSRGNAINIALCFAVAVLEGFDIQAIGVAAPKIAAALQIAPDQMSWVFSGSNLALVFGASVGGWLADKIGRKRVFMVAVALFGLFTLATAWAQSYETLVAVRVGAGLGFGAALPNMMAIAADISVPERRALTATAMFCGMPLGGGTVALYTQTLPPDFDWRLIFMVGGVVPLLLVPVLGFFMRESAPVAAAERTRVDALKAWFGEGRAVPTLLLWVAFFPTLLILYLILYWLPTLVVAKGFDRAVAPQAAIAFNYASVVGALLLGWLVDKIGPRWPLTIAFAGLIGVILALATSSDFTTILILSGAAGFLLLGANYALNGVAAGYYPKALRGTGSGGAVAIGRAGSTVGPALPGLLLTAGASANQIIDLMAPAAAAAGLAVFAVSFFRRAPEA